MKIQTLLIGASLVLAACASTEITGDPDDPAKSSTELRSAVGAFITACVGKTQQKNIEASFDSLGMTKTEENAAKISYTSPFGAGTLQRNGICTITPADGSAAQVARLLDSTLPNAGVGAEKQNSETWLLNSGAVVLVSPDGTMTRTAIGGRG
ncbi:MAG: hypothetical protein HKN27_02975 [Silicimonas sp.]|nr:hypothetical protein [Silicimonas sp.]